MARQLPGGRSRPVTAPDNPARGACPNPAAVSVSHRLWAGSCNAIFAVPMLLDLATICSTVSNPCELVSEIVRPPILIHPGEVCTVDCGVTTPASSAVAIENGLMVEPGSKVS